jgi:hypothetical protein
MSNKQPTPVPIFARPETLIQIKSAVEPFLGKVKIRQLIGKPYIYQIEVDHVGDDHR